MQYDEEYIAKVRQQREQELVGLHRREQKVEKAYSRSANKFRLKPKTEKPEKAIVKRVVKGEWSAEENDFLYAKWMEGLTARAIADLLNDTFKSNRSRNSVIGRIHRIRDRQNKPELARQSPIKLREAGPQVRSKKRKSLKELCSEKPQIDFAQKSDTMCREFGCFEQITRGSYCAIHAKQFYVDKKQKEKVSNAAAYSGYTIKRYFR